MKPLRELGLAIVKASVDCLNGIKLLIEVPAGIERQKAEIFAFYEFLHFFLHITMRDASAVMSEHEIKHLWLGGAALPRQIQFILRVRFKFLRENRRVI